jgi:uncharacterized membrane protein YdbT with pleckstrin-like domain
MYYVKQILLPDENVVYDGHVHPKVFAPGLFLLAAAAAILLEGSGKGGGHYYLLRVCYHMAQEFPSLKGFYTTLYRWQMASPGIALETKLMALVVVLMALSKLAKAYVLTQSFELVVTNQRVIAKHGIMTIVTAEMNRHRIAEVTVDQSFIGRILGYGHIFIRGFTGTIGGLPAMANPYMIERYIMSDK